MVQLLTDLRHPGAVRVLDEVLRRPMPPERSEDPAHGLSTVGEEIIIRTTAVDNFYGTVICNQAYIDYFWNTYGFSGNKDYWDDGFGWEDRATPTSHWPARSTPATC